MEKKDILTQATNLKNRVHGINQWIKEHPEVTDPNMYEYIDCLVQFGEIAREMTLYYDENGWPKKEGSDEGFTHYEVWKCDPELTACFLELKELKEMRKIGQEGFGAMTIDPMIHDYLATLEYRCVAGEYKISNQPNMVALKRELLCKSFSIPFYIWQVKRMEPDYQYDNMTEWNGVLAMYDQYNVNSPIEDLVDDYMGPQFGYFIEQVIDRVNQNYKYKGTIPSLVKKK